MPTHRGVGEEDACVFIQWKVGREKRSLVIAPTWMDLEGIMLSEISQRKTNIASFHVSVQLLSRVRLFATP